MMLRIGGISVVALLAGVMLPVSSVPAQRGVAPAAGADPVKAGVDAWASGNYDRALGVWRPLAAAGNPDAQYNLAQAYRLGRGVTVDQKLAQDWYYKAAVQNHPQAQANYGLLLFQNGDRAGALPWLQKAADRGDPRAQYVVGTALFNGDVAQKDWVRAYALMTRAAASGLQPAATSLTEMDKYVPLQQRQRGTAVARDMERSAALAMVDESDRLARSAPAADQAPARAVQVASAPIATAPVPPPPAHARPSAAVRPAPPPVPHAAIQAYAEAKPPKPAPVRATPPKPAPRPAAVAAPPAARLATPVAKPIPASVTKPVRAPGVKPAPRPAPVAVAAANGGWRVQVGAYGDPAAAGRAWSGIAGKVPGLRQYLVKAGPMTRLQAGPIASRADASKACARIKAATGTPCFPVAAQ